MGYRDWLEDWKSGNWLLHYHMPWGRAKSRMDCTRVKWKFKMAEEINQMVGVAWEAANGHIYTTIYLYNAIIMYQIDNLKRVKEQTMFLIHTCLSRKAVLPSSKCHILMMMVWMGCIFDDSMMDEEPVFLPYTSKEVIYLPTFFPFHQCLYSQKWCGFCFERKRACMMRVMQSMINNIDLKCILLEDLRL